MVNMTIRNLDDAIKQRLRIQAAEHGHSMEEEARAILRAALAEPAPPANLARAIRACFAPLGGVELDLPPRQPMRDPSQFG
ncbi:MAG: plasmid stabilization protein [Gemmatimonadetes bacterium]|nr:plasmid stabilization protein [Gemmatimonadota bacterium]